MISDTGFVVSTREFIVDHFDKLLLTAILLGLMLFALFGTDSVTSWSLQQAGVVLGALVTLVTGRAMRSGKSKGPANSR